MQKRTLDRIRDLSWIRYDHFEQMAGVDRRPVSQLSGGSMTMSVVAETPYSGIF
ncbi:MAG: hypothetical protein OXH13_08375 [Chloroflexi bacterium]|nr:hypothetical protein [Chloroflexota bacterium]